MATVPTRILLVRHGATLLSVEDRFAGSSDVDLSNEGQAQAGDLARQLAKEPVAAAYCSPMRRTVETAARVCARHNLVATPLDGLREISHGHWEGLVHRDVEREYAAEYAAWDADPLLVAPPGGENGISVLARALPAVRQIVLDHPGQTVLVVSHKATNRLVIASLLGIDPRLYRARIAQDLACLNVLEFRDPTQARLLLLNDTSHIAASGQGGR